MEVDMTESVKLVRVWQSCGPPNYAPARTILELYIQGLWVLDYSIVLQRLMVLFTDLTDSPPLNVDFHLRLLNFVSQNVRTTKDLVPHTGR